jgi:uncharacterized protein YbcI
MKSRLKERSVLEEKGRQKVLKLTTMNRKQEISRALAGFFRERFGKSADMEVKILDDLILLRCKGAVLPAEVELSNMKAGRILLQEASERLCQELQPDVNRFLRKTTGRRLLDMCVVIFFKQREKIIVLAIGDRIKR